MLFIQFKYFKLYIYLIYFTAWLIDKSHRTSHFFLLQIGLHVFCTIEQAAQPIALYSDSAHCTRAVGCVDKTTWCTQHYTVCIQPTSHHSWSCHTLINNLSHFFNAYFYFINYHKLPHQLIIWCVSYQLICIIVILIYWTCNKLIFICTGLDFKVVMALEKL